MLTAHLGPHQIPHADDHCNRELFGVCHLLPGQAATEAAPYSPAAPYPTGIQAQCDQCDLWLQVPDSVARVRGHTGAPFSCAAAGRECRRIRRENRREESPTSAGALEATVEGAAAAAAAALADAFPADSAAPAPVSSPPVPVSSSPVPVSSPPVSVSSPSAPVSSLPVAEVVEEMIPAGDPVVAFPMRHYNNGDGCGSPRASASSSAKFAESAEPNVDNGVEVSAILAAAPSREAVVVRAAAADPFAADLCTAFADLLWHPQKARALIRLPSRGHRSSCGHVRRSCDYHHLNLPHDHTVLRCLRAWRPPARRPPPATLLSAFPRWSIAGRATSNGRPSAWCSSSRSR